MTKALLIALVLAGNVSAYAQQLFQMPARTESRVSTFENLNGQRGQGGQTNRQAKGNAFELVKPGESRNLLDIAGAGVIQRIWITVNRSPEMPRSMRLQMFWDQSVKPAVDVPMGDFFGYNLGEGVPFESALFSSGEGRSFNCYIPMPFRKGARVVLINEGTQTCKLFFDVDFVLQAVPDDAMYFHAWWSRQRTGKPGDDFVILPRVTGKGRFLGASFGLITDASYGRKNGWCEGEVKMYLDDDGKLPTINGTGTEDYIGSAWGLGKFINQYQGCTIADDSAGRYNFYRWHVPDAIYFQSNIRVTLQQMGGGMTNDVREVLRAGARLVPVTVETPKGFMRLLEMSNPPDLLSRDFPEGWVSFYRVDDYNAVSLFYLDRPFSDLPPLAPVADRR